ncbi:MAG TPA: flagellin, partial [Candidatus Anaerobiospirillum stercoravium]|nr:flagellin [Candidatus Anaerobiospirillum stercoravium]
TYTRLSSGLRINSAKDDAAGLQIADRLTSQINGLNQGNRNANDGIALAQTIEGGLDEISNMLQRIRTLAVQSANGTLGNDDREAIQKEADALTTEIQRIAEETTFGGKTILNGQTADSIYVSHAEPDPDGDGKVNGCTAMLKLHVGANTGNIIEMRVYNFVFSRLASAAGLTGSTGYSIGATDAPMEGIGHFDLSIQTAANDAIAGIDAMIAIVDSQRADLGAIQNRLESSIRNQSNVSANSADARSRIRDADFAEESANLSQQSIIQQAATSMLMQANTRPQLALSMLG